MTPTCDREPQIRTHVERLPDGIERRTGVWIANQKQRLDADQLTALRELGVDWARWINGRCSRNLHEEPPDLQRRR
ncbi:hypothetical protein ACODT5_45350 [Streptomyces sp. 5.8]|uniref:hypothetical protein n=1 Tax=Streptomyces sp. 5.8 TaxID=3406571 RepID=UPI003BB54CD2